MIHYRAGDIVGARGRTVPWTAKAKTGLARALVLAAVILLAGCDEEPPAPETAAQAAARERAETAAAGAEDASTPDLRDVPDRPAATSTASTRDRVVEGLIADRENARYTDEAIRLQGTGRQVSRSSAPAKATAPAPAAAAASTPAPVKAPPPAVPAAVVAPPPAPPPAASSAPLPKSPAASPAPQLAATPPPVPRAPTPVPPPPQTSSAGRTPPLASPALPAAPPPQSGQAAAPKPAVVVDRSALDAIGRAPTGDPLTASISGNQVATIQFAQSSARLDARDREILQQVAAIQRQSGASVIVVGHASSRTRQLDKVKHEIANLDISMARASAVADALIESGVSRDQVVVEAVSDARPIYVEAMPTGEAGNRRAEIYLVQ